MKAAIFDIDGTLIDSVDLHAMAWVRALSEWGFNAEFAKMRSQIGKGGDQLLPEFVPKDKLAEIEEELSQYRADLWKREFLPMVRGFACVPQLFARIRQTGAKIALASSAKGDELAAYKKIAGITEYVEEETSSDDAERSKPEPDIFAAVLEKLGVNASEAVVVGDTPYDAIAAGKIGLKTVGVRCGGWTEEQLREAGCVAVYRNPAELWALFEESPLAQ